jgi:hypothetical protein
MKLLICLSVAMFLTPSVRAEDNTALGQFTLPEYEASGLTPQRVDAVFPEDAPRGGGSLYGSTFRWERDQRAAWGGGIPGLTASEGQSACGLIAAEALIRHNSNNLNLDKIVEIRNTAVRNGRWDQNNGMHGPDSEQQLLADFGVRVSAPIWSGNLYQLIRESLDRGKPVIVSTNAHYFFVEGYNNNGQLFVGYTGEVMRCGAAQMTLDQISGCGGGALALLIPQ